MSNKRITQLSTATTTTDKYVMVDKVGQTEAEKVKLDSILGLRAGSQSLTAGLHAISFSTSYEVGSSYALWVRAIDSDGYDIGAVDSDRTVSGFNITVTDSCTFEYIAAKL